MTASFSPNVAEAYGYGIEGNIIASYIEDPRQFIDHRDDRSIGTWARSLPRTASMRSLALAPEYSSG